MLKNKEEALAYITGVALGDGNLSNPNGRAIRLRITCDLKYPGIIKRIEDALSILLPNNAVSFFKRTETYGDISCYSNKWNTLLNWSPNLGSKYKQNVSVPRWIMNDKRYTCLCLRGLFETDGSIYVDRGYKMVNFVTIIPTLAHDVIDMIQSVGSQAHIYKIKQSNRTRYTIRISKNVDDFIKKISLQKN